MTLTLRMARIALRCTHDGKYTFARADAIAGDTKGFYIKSIQNDRIKRDIYRGFYGARLDLTVEENAQK